MAARYQRILIAVDGSDDADQVLTAARALEPHDDERIDVVTVIPPMLSGVSGMAGATFATTFPVQDLQASMTREITERVRERIARFGVPAERLAVLFGRPAQEIQSQAERLGADLIVVGSHGRQGLSRVMLGSTANGVLHGAKCDVLTVRITD